MKDKRLREYLHLEVDKNTGQLKDAYSYGMNTRLTDLEKKMNAIFNYLNVYYKTHPSENLPRLVKICEGAKNANDH